MAKRNVKTTAIEFAMEMNRIADIASCGHRFFSRGDLEMASYCLNAVMDCIEILAESSGVSVERIAKGLNRRAWFMTWFGTVRHV